MTNLSILWLTPDKPDNISVGRERIASHLEKIGHEVTLRGTTVRTIAQSLTERSQYDLVMGTTRSGAIAGIVVSRICGVPLIVDHIDPIRQLRATESDIVVRFVQRLEHLAFRLAAHVLYVYPEEESRLVGRATRTTKTNLGVDFDRFADPNPSVIDQARDRLDTVPENLAIYIGGLEPLYSIDPLLEAAKKLDDWTLLVIGAGSMEPEVKRAADSENIQFLGTVPHEEIPGYLHLADVGISLVDDQHTLKVLEYGAAGLPVVQLSGSAKNRFDELLTYTESEANEIAKSIKHADIHGATNDLSSFSSKFDWKKITKDYSKAIKSVI